MVRNCGDMFKASALSLRERVAEGRVRVIELPQVAHPLPALRATFSQREKGEGGIRNNSSDHPHPRFAQEPSPGGRGRSPCHPGANHNTLSTFFQFIYTLIDRAYG